MSLHKEVLHSFEMKKILEEIAKESKDEPGLKPHEYSEEDLYMLYNLGHRLYQVDDYQNAEKIFKRLILAKPYEMNHWRALASVQQMQKRHYDSLVSWSMCCLLEETNPLFHYWAALCLYELGETTQAIDAMKTALAYAKEDASLKETIKTLLDRWHPQSEEEEQAL